MIASRASLFSRRKTIATLAWIAGQTRPDLSYRISELQTVTGKPRVEDLHEADKILERALQTFESEGPADEPPQFVETT